MYAGVSPSSHSRTSLCHPSSNNHCSCINSVRSPIWKWHSEMPRRGRHPMGAVHLMVAIWPTIRLYIRRELKPIQSVIDFDKNRFSNLELAGRFHQRPIPNPDRHVQYDWRRRHGRWAHRWADCQRSSHSPDAQGGIWSSNWRPGLLYYLQNSRFSEILKWESNFFSIDFFIGSGFWRSLSYGRRATGWKRDVIPT